MALWCLLLLVALALVAAEPRGLEFLMGEMTNDHTASSRTNAVVPESSMLVQAPDLNTAHPLPGTGYDGGKAIKSSTLKPGDPPPQVNHCRLPDVSAHLRMR